MSYSELNQLSLAEELFDAAKLDEALEILNDRVHFEELNTQQKDHFQLLKGLILFYQWKSDELIEFGEQIFQEGQNFNDSLQSFDGLFFIIIGLASAEKYEEALPKIETAEDYLGLISDLSKNVFFQRKARIRLLKGWVNLELNKLDVAEKCLNWIINSHNKLGNTFEIVYANFLKGRLVFQGKKMYTLGGEYMRKALSIAKQIKFNHFWIALGQFLLGAHYSHLGEVDIGLKYSLKSLAIFRQIKNNYFIAMALTNISANYFQLGNFNLGRKYAEECLSYQETLSLALDFSLSNLVKVGLEIGDNELIQKYYNQLKNLYNQKKDALSELIYLSTKALMLKKSSRIRDKAKAEKIFRKIIDTDTLWSQFTIGATVHLCDLLLSEYRFTNSNEVLEELNHCIIQLLTIAEKTHSYIVFCETFILQAKLALLNLDMKAARRYLTQAQKIAEKYGIKQLAMKISHEHDELLRQINLWEKLKDSESSLTERWNFSGVNEQMNNMVKSRMTKVPELSEEEPVFLLIVSEGGTPFFSHSFIEDIAFESHLFGGFLTTIDYFIKQMFSEGLDRAMFGEYTLLMNSIPPFFISYIFKGNSYFAHQKINYFMENIQKIENLWQQLLNSFQLHQTVHLKDIPLLESLVTKTFIEKNYE